MPQWLTTLAQRNLALSAIVVLCGAVVYLFFDVQDLHNTSAKQLTECNETWSKALSECEQRRAEDAVKIRDQLMDEIFNNRRAIMGLEPMRKK